MKKGDVVLIPFPFTDLSGSKNCPEVILVVAEAEVTVSFITSQLKWQEEHDLIFQPSVENGLKRASILKLSKITTLEKATVIGRLGQLHASEIRQMNENLIHLSQLEN